MSVVLQCQNLVKTYAQGHLKLEVLAGLDFDVHAGQQIAIVGASGSGKSTLLNLLGGLDKPDSGEVLVAGARFSELSENERGRVRNRYLGFVYQFHHLLGEFSALENVAMPLLIGRTPKPTAMHKAAALLDRVGLAQRTNHKPSELSGGERQRVAIARALANEPACVLMDEPTGNLDRRNAEAIQGLMHDLSSTLATAFVVVTHDEEFAGRMDAAFELREGKLMPRGVSV